MNQEIRKILPAIFLIAAVYLGYLSWQGYQEILILRQQIKESKDKTATLNSAFGKTENLAFFAKENPTAVERINIFLPENINKPGIISVLTEAASASSLLLKSINFTDSSAAQAASAQGSVSASAEEKISTQDINLVFSGTYSSLKNFLVFMEKNLKLTDIASIDFGSVEKSEEASQIASYDFTVNLRTYYIAKNNSINKESKILTANNLVDLAFTKESIFTDLVSPKNYYIDTADTGDWGNKNIF